MTSSPRGLPEEFSPDQLSTAPCCNFSPYLPPRHQALRPNCGRQQSRHRFFFTHSPTKDLRLSFLPARPRILYISCSLSREAVSRSACFSGATLFRGSFLASYSASFSCGSFFLPCRRVRLAVKPDWEKEPSKHSTVPSACQFPRSCESSSPADVRISVIRMAPPRFRIAVGCCCRVGFVTPARIVSLSAGVVLFLIPEVFCCAGQYSFMVRVVSSRGPPSSSFTTLLARGRSPLADRVSTA